MARKEKNVALNSKLSNVDYDNNTAISPSPQGKLPKNVKAKEKKIGFFGRIGKFFKELVSELKKVSWAPAKKTFVSTGIVLAVVGVFFFVLLGIDSLFTALMGLLVG